MRPAHECFPAAVVEALARAHDIRPADWDAFECALYAAHGGHRGASQTLGPTADTRALAQAWALRKALNYVDRPEMLNRLSSDEGYEDWAVNRAEAVAAIAATQDLLARLEQAEPTTVPPSRRPDPAKRAAVAPLLHFWRALGRSGDLNNRSGPSPAVRFLRDCLQPLNPSISERFLEELSDDAEMQETAERICRA